MVKVKDSLLLRSDLAFYMKAYEFSSLSTNILDCSKIPFYMFHICLLFWVLYHNDYILLEVVVSLLF